MDHAKTGLLIAQRRKELDLTQKDLANKLHISDRTVSKWERGVGFPDLSLLEPLADALGLSVLELLHGERQPEIKGDADHSSRETLRALREEFGSKLESLKRLSFFFFRLLPIAVVLLLFLYLIPIPHYTFSNKEISASRAIELCPYILITTDEVRLMENIMADPTVIALQKHGAPADLEASATEHYREKFLIGGTPVDSLDILIFESGVSASCQQGDEYFLLSVDNDGAYLKTAVNHHFLSRRTVENWNNTRFSTLAGKRDLLAPLLAP